MTSMFSNNPLASYFCNGFNGKDIPITGRIRFVRIGRFNRDRVVISVTFLIIMVIVVILMIVTKLTAII